jgi:hypothetical protein
MFAICKLPTKLSGERRVESGELRVENGEWKVENGELRVESGEWQACSQFLRVVIASVAKQSSQLNK